MAAVRAMAPVRRVRRLARPGAVLPVLALLPRAAAADEVNVVVSSDGSQVQIYGDGNANDVTISQSNGTVTSNGTTKVKGTASFPAPKTLSG